MNARNLAGAGFGENGRISDLPEPKSGATQIILNLLQLYYCHFISKTLISVVNSSSQADLALCKPSHRCLAELLLDV